ncbi:TetR/AcrR family transcriptional regulator [Microbacterium sp. NPDC056052]|uniref:TetR/AcrR family transcriptional regulator n=1 Tax=Microbacterium sp. NPDC056052 TaxID=3345695 RepID=UPI0035D88E64
MVTSGRPRKSSIDDAILQATAELITDLGYARLTVTAIIERAGTNKPAFYRRFQNVAEVVPRVLASRHGVDTDIDTGSLAGDLIEVQRRQERLFTDPVVTRGIAGWLAEVEADPEQGRPFFEHYLGPRRAYTRVILERAVARGEIPQVGDPAWIADLLTGPLLMRVAFPGMPRIDGALLARTVHSALDSLGCVGDRRALSSLDSIDEEGRYPRRAR